MQANIDEEHCPYWRQHAIDSVGYIHLGHPIVLILTNLLARAAALYCTCKDASKGCFSCRIEHVPMICQNVAAAFLPPCGTCFTAAFGAGGQDARWPLVSKHPQHLSFGAFVAG